MPIMIAISPSAKVMLPGQSGAEEPDGAGAEKDQSPLNRREDPAEDEPDERAADARDLIDAERHAALVLGKGVGEDRRGVGDEDRGADALEDAHDDEIQRRRRARHPGDAK